VRLQHLVSFECPSDALQQRIGRRERIAGNTQRLEHALPVDLMLLGPEWKNITVPRLRAVLFDRAPREMDACHGAKQLEAL
jgi:hypothetical protein